MSPYATTETSAPRARPLSGLAKPIRLEWVDKFPQPLQEEVLDLMNAVLARETTIGFAGPLTYSEGMRWMAGTARAVTNGDKHLLLFRDTDDKVVGHVLMTPNALPNCRHIGEISRTFVHPDYRGVSIVRMGLRSVLDRADQIGLEVIQLDVRDGTRIAKLWQALGFQVVGKMEDYARVNGESFPGLFMYQHVKVLRQRLERTADDTLS